MTAGLGLRVGDTTAIAILQRGGDLLDEPPAVVRAATLLLGEDAAVLGAPADREGVLSRFTSRVGDPVGLSAPDGTSYLAEDLVATAVSGLLVAATEEFPGDFPNNAALPVVATYPSHWDAATVAALREALDHVGQASVTLTPDAVAAVAWLEAAHGPLGDAVVAVYHLGSAGLDVSLVRTGTDPGLLRPSTYTTLFGGDSLDRTVVEHVLSVVAADLGPVDTADPATRAQLTTLRERCREAREQLSTQDTAAVPVEVAGAHTTVTLTRTELDEMLRGQVSGSLTMVEESIRAHEIEPGAVRTVLLAGGGSAMPLVTELAAQALDLPTVSAPEPSRVVAYGAALLAGGANPALLANDGVALTVGGVALAAEAAGLAAGHAAPASPLDGEDDTDSIPVVTPDAGLSTAWGAAATPPGAAPSAAVTTAADAEVAGDTRRGLPDRAVLIGVGVAVAVVAAAAILGFALIPRGATETPLPRIAPVSTTSAAVTTTTPPRPSPTPTSALPSTTVDATTTTVAPTTPTRAPRPPVDIPTPDVTTLPPTTKTTTTTTAPTTTTTSTRTTTKTTQPTTTTTEPPEPTCDPAEETCKDTAAG